MTTDNGADNQPQENPQAQKVKGLLKLVHLFAGSSVIIKGAIIAAALVAGYSSVIYYHGRNNVSTIAEEVVKDETGLDMKFSEHMSMFSPE